MVDEWTDPLNWSATQGNADPTPLSLRRGGPLLESTSIASLSDRRNGGQSPRPRHGRPPPRRGYFIGSSGSEIGPGGRPAFFGCTLPAWPSTLPNHISVGSSIASAACEIRTAGSPWSPFTGSHPGDRRSARSAKRPAIAWCFPARWRLQPSRSNSKLRGCSWSPAGKSPPPSTADRFPPMNRRNCGTTGQARDRCFASADFMSLMFIVSIAPHFEFEIAKPRA